MKNIVFTYIEGEKLMINKQVVSIKEKFNSDVLSCIYNENGVIEEIVFKQGLIVSLFRAGDNCYKKIRKYNSKETLFFVTHYSNGRIGDNNDFVRFMYEENIFEMLIKNPNVFDNLHLALIESSNRLKTLEKTFSNEFLFSTKKNIFKYVIKNEQSFMQQIVKNIQNTNNFRIRELY